ncbi:OsmC family protein [Streptomyces sp. ok210]|jgi:uncharacterized OsmC-like protein|uniref:OsmC family protein n=1 Tax=Streptomyces sp. ok210 TaxID=1761905 RepID=UPI000B84BAE2|nr:OsmC family protein [Streptomyces sp. ok210]
MGSVVSGREHEVSVSRTGPHEFLGRNSRGATVRLGFADAEEAFTPGELLQIALAGCMSLTVEELVTRRAGEDAALEATAGSWRAPGVREYQRIWVDLDVDLSFLDTVTRERVAAAMRRAVEGQCTAHRTLEKGAEIALAVETDRASNTALQKLP